jgi:hypothetical protein
MNNFHEQLLTNAGMAAAHAVLISKYEWFVHATIADVFTKVKGCGLQPRLPETGHPWPEVLQQLGCGGSNIICLSPYPRNQILLLNKGGKSVFKLALHCDALPRRIGFDWSLMGTRQRSCDMRRSSTSLLDEQIFLRMIQNSESVVSYDPIAASVLRVCPEDARESHPATWPLLTDSSSDDIAIFAPDIVGNVSIK